MTTFTYQNKKYCIKNIPFSVRNNEVFPLLKLPDGTILQVLFWKDNVPDKLMKVEMIFEVQEVPQPELAFQSLLQQYNLLDNAKSRKLWFKCYEQSSKLEGQIKWFHELVDLIKDD